MLKTILRSPITTVVLFVLAVGLLLFGGINAVRAAPSIVSQTYGAQVQLTSISTALLENDVEVSDGGELMKNLLPSGETLKLGKSYSEVLKAKNDGVIDEYLRVTVTKYWTDGNGKRIDLDPALIKLNYPADKGWTIDKAASTEERTVLYYGSVVAPGGTTNEFIDKVTISSDVLKAVTTAADGTDTYDYENVNFHVQAVVDAVQTHNGPAAMTGVWGRTI